ncbi:MAG: aminotransferase class V-fold PLP-dependent enzyme [Spartobacteria bacterium]
MVENGIFLGHAGVTILPRRAADAMKAHAEASCHKHQEFGEVLRDVARTRSLCAKLIGANADEIALLGPTSLGLSLFANGLDWQAGDEVLYYGDDYPANVYPWTALASRGVVARELHPDLPGAITPKLVEAALTPRTKLVALASCHYLSGRRIDVRAIGRLLRSNGVLFSLDAIQTLGAAPLDVEFVDFLSADAHKWMLGPMAIGIVYVARRNFEKCRPTLLGAWNVKSPDFIAQKEIVFEATARRYEPGVLNISGMYGMKASLEMLLEIGLENVQSAILENRDYLEEKLSSAGFKFLSPRADDSMRSGILTTRHPSVDSAAIFSRLESAGVSASLRKSHCGKNWIRFSPHFYNNINEMTRVAEIMTRGFI